MSSRDVAGPGDAARWWATLTPEALEDEIRSNRRSERRLLLVVTVVSLAVTAVALLVHGGVP